jgi:hypothetical protein
MIKSTFFPLSFLSPKLGNSLFEYVSTFALLGAAATMFWFFAFGVNEQRWREQAGLNVVGPGN